MVEWTICLEDAFAVTQCLVESLSTAPTLLSVYMQTKTKKLCVNFLITVSSADGNKGNRRGAWISVIFMSQTTNCKATPFNNSNGLDQFLLLETPKPLWTGNRSVPLRTDDPWLQFQRINFQLNYNKSSLDDLVSHPLPHSAPNSSVLMQVPRNTQQCKDVSYLIRCYHFSI